MTLYEKLKAYGDSDTYGFHMPGHKRILGEFENPYRFDITEIDDFDDLHHPEPGGVLVKAQERAAALYRSEETHFLVNGSTSGIQSAICGTTRRGGTLLLARNSHRSAYTTAALCNLNVSYLYPQTVESLGINGGILPEDVDNALKADGEIQAVLITSPTYDGVCSDVRSIAEICHGYGVPLLVDQAHGAHFPFSEYFPEDAVSAGADVVIHSLHKTLPSLTQTALLHVNGTLVDREKIRYYLSVFQSSSPSYVLMASMDACMEFLEQEGAGAFSSYRERLEEFRAGCRELKRLSLAGGELIGSRGIADFDCSKLLVSLAGTKLTGNHFSELLRERYHLQMEMAAPTYVVGISSVADTEEGFARFLQALKSLDGELLERAEKRQVQSELPRAEVRLCPGEAQEREKELLPLRESAGRIAGAYLYLYPPGIPLLVPGEELKEEAVQRMEEYLAMGFEVHGLREDGSVPVLKEK